MRRGNRLLASVNRKKRVSQRAKAQNVNGKGKFGKIKPVENYRFNSVTVLE